MLKTKVRLVGVDAHHRLELSQGHVWSSQHKGSDEKPALFCHFPSEKYGCLFTSSHLHGWDADISLEPKWMEGGVGVEKTVTA